MMKRTRPWSTNLALTSLILLGACSDPQSGGKGEEEGALTGGKADSLEEPINAGELRFGPQRELTFDESHHYYALTFSLSDSAKIAVTTQILTTNLDTVLYLYHRSAGSADWGKYLATNDDFEEGSPASRIALEQAAAGEYRIIVKPFKLSMKGKVAVVGECAGPGCPVVGPGECNPSQITRKLPPETGYGPSCAATLIELLPNEVEVMSLEEVTFAQRCQLSAIESKAVELYHDYFSDFQSWEDFTGGEGDAALLTVKHLALNGYQVSGDVISVDLDSLDEDVVTFVFDGDGNLVSALHEEQSSTNLWFCAKPGESDQGEPSPDCMSAAYSYLPHDPDEVYEDSGKLRVRDINDDDEVPSFVHLVAARYVQLWNLGDDDELSYTYVHADSSDGYGRGMKVELQAWEESLVTYLLADDDHETTLLLEAQGNLPPEFVCEAL